MRVAAVFTALLGALPALAQHDLATTRDGSVLYFSLQAKNFGDTKIYRWTRESGVTLFADRPEFGDPATGLPAQLYGTDTTDTGVVIFHAGRVCPLGDPLCPVGKTVVNIPQSKPFDLEGYLFISSSGQYGMFAPYKSGVLWVDWFTGEEIEVELSPFETIAGVALGLSGNRDALANDGSILIITPAGLRVWSKNGSRNLRPPHGRPIRASISADGSTVLVENCIGGVPIDPVCLYDLTSGQQFSVKANVVRMSDDGKTVAYSTGTPNDPEWVKPQVIVGRPDETGILHTTNLPEGVGLFALSGDGRVLFLVPADPRQDPRRIIRYEVETGAVQEIVVNQ